MGAIAYFVTPADAIPDFIVGLGFTDDAAVLMAAISAIGRYLKPEHRARAREAASAATQARGWCPRSAEIYNRAYRARGGPGSEAPDGITRLSGGSTPSPARDQADPGERAAHSRWRGLRDDA